MITCSKKQSRSRLLFSSLVLLLTFILSSCSPNDESSSNFDVVASAVLSNNYQPTAKITGTLIYTAGETVTLDGSNSSDPEGDALNYNWLRAEGPDITPLAASTATLSFVAPMVSQVTQFTYELTVSDGLLSSSASANIQVTPLVPNMPPNQQPNARVTAPLSSTSGQTVILDGSSSSDPDNDMLSYLWTQKEGPHIMLLNSTSPTLRFEAPPVTEITQVTFELNVNDNEFSNSTNVSILITPKLDITSPSIISMSPQIDQSRVPAMTEISVIFDEALLASSVDSQSLVVSQNGSPVAGVVSYDSANHIVTNKPTSNLTPGESYTVTLSNSLTDLAGNAFAGESWSFSTDSLTPVCATAEESNSLTLSCPSGQVVKEVVFASYGIPDGSCGSFTTGSCMANNSMTVVSDACKGRSSCTVYAGNDKFGDPCGGTVKKLAAQVACGMVTDTNPDPTPDPSPIPDPNSVTDAGGRLWHPLTLTFTGPATSEDAEPNPFYNYRLDVTFKQGNREVIVPGYFAADGDAANTSATSGDKWRVHFVPDTIGVWTYSVSFRQGNQVAVSNDLLAGEPVAPNGLTGTLTIAPSDKSGRDNRYRGTLEYVGEHYAQFKGTGEYFILEGAQSPENFMGYGEFDNTVDHGGGGSDMKDGVHWYEPHIKHWREGDPTWKGGKGKGIIGALNYLASKGMNTYYSLFMNVDGDFRETYPFIDYREYERYDVSKLAQWNIVLSHGDTLGMMLMLITQEEENEKILGKMTPKRKLYYRELISRFAHHHALQWELDEEMDKYSYYTTDDIKEMASFFKNLDPYKHPVQYVQYKAEILDKKNMPDYERLLGFPDFDATALQMDPENVNTYTRRWRDASAAAGHKWLTGAIEINLGNYGVPPDENDYWRDSIRQNAIWGNLMAGGSGTVYHFGEKFPNSDNDCEDWSTRDHFWEMLDIARQFFVRHLPFWQMDHADDLVAGSDDYVFAKQGDIYAIYLKKGGSPTLDLDNATGNFTVQWYDPRNGGELQDGNVTRVTGGSRRSLGNPPEESGKDWTILVKREGLRSEN